MSFFHESIKKILKDIDGFLNVTLKNTKLNSKQTAEKEAILLEISNVQEEFPQLRWDTDNDNNEDQEDTSAGSKDGDFAIEPIALADLKNCTAKGFLLKQRKPEQKVRKMFGPQKRYCAISQGIFYYYEKETDKKQSGAFYLKDYEARACPNQPKKTEFLFEIVAPGKRTYQFIAELRTEMDYWIEKINADTGTGNQSGSGSGSGSSGAKSIPPKSVSSEADDEEYECVDEITEPKAQEGEIYDEPEPQTIQEDIYDDNEVPTQNAITEEFYDDVDIETSKEDNKETTSSPPLPPLKSVPPKPNNTSTPPPPKRQQPTPPTPEPPVIKRKEGQDYENQFYGLWKCSGTSDKELSFSQGDLIHILERTHDNEGWWLGELKTGKLGFVPKNYLTPVYERVSG